MKLNLPSPKKRAWHLEAFCWQKDVIKVIPQAPPFPNLMCMQSEVFIMQKDKCKSG
jgi:hypothetical protein